MSSHLEDNYDLTSIKSEKIPQQVTIQILCKKKVKLINNLPCQSTKVKLKSISISESLNYF